MPGVRATSNTTARRRVVAPGSGRPVGSWLALLFVLAGLFAMHGLGTHGTHAAHEPAGMHASATNGHVVTLHDVASGDTGDTLIAAAMPAALAPDPMNHAKALLALAPSPLAAVSGDARVSAGTGEASGWMALCLAILAAALVLAIGVARRALVGAADSVHWIYAPASPIHGRDRSPPCLEALSIRRC